MPKIFFKKVNHTINICGDLLDLSEPKVMGVININSDSFYEASRAFSERDIVRLLEKHMSEGVDIIDIGAMSSRPGAVISDPDEEGKVIKWALNLIKKVYNGHISVDTVHSSVASLSYNEGAHMINDISAGNFDPLMMDTVAKCKLPFIAMHMQGKPQDMQLHPDYQNVTKEVIHFFSEKLYQADCSGINDVIIDPGFGFGKTLQHNYDLLSNLELFTLLQKPLLVGLSRKSMIYKLLETIPEHALNGTTSAHTIALMKGAHILRVHDVKAAKECIKIVRQIK